MYISYFGAIHIINQVPKGHRGIPVEKKNTQAHQQRVAGHELFSKQFNRQQQGGSVFSGPNFLSRLSYLLSRLWTLYDVYDISIVYYTIFVAINPDKADQAQYFKV